MIIIESCLIFYWIFFQLFFLNSFILSTRFYLIQVDHFCHTQKRQQWMELRGKWHQDTPNYIFGVTWRMLYQVQVPLNLILIKKNLNYWLGTLFWQISNQLLVVPLLLLAQIGLFIVMLEEKIRELFLYENMECK